MTEKNKTSTPTLRPVENRQRDEQNSAERSIEMGRVEYIRRVIIIGAILSIGTIVFYAWLYSQSEIWQILLDGSGLLLALGFILLAYWSSRRGKLDAAGYWLLIALILPFVASELAWTGETIFNMIGGILLILLAGSLVLRQKKTPWSISISLYIIAILAIFRFEPLHRLSVETELPVLYYFDLGLTVLLALIAVSLVVRALYIGTIRTRLRIAFVSLVLLTAIAVGAGSVFTSFQSRQDQTIVYLESVAAFKETEIDVWTSRLETELVNVLIGQGAMLHIQILLQAESETTAEYQDSYSRLRARFRETIKPAGQFEELFLLNPQGRIIVSTDAAQENQSQHQADYFQQGLEGSYVQPPVYFPALEQMAIVFARPVLDSQGRILGVLAGRVSISPLEEIVLQQVGLGETNEMFLVSVNRVLLTALGSGERGVYINTVGANTVLDSHGADSGVYENHRGRRVLGVQRWLDTLHVALLIEQDQAQVYLGTYPVFIVTGFVTLIALLLATVAAFFFTRSIATPLADLAKIATQVAAGDLDRTVQVVRRDEIGVLAQSFNSMTTQLRDVISGLEQRVAERTRELERRSAYMGTSAEVAHAASSILDVTKLSRQVVELIRERFDLYYVGLFATDEVNEWAVLQAGTGEAGRLMLARGHRLKIGFEGMIGWSIANAQARIALYAEQDTVRALTAELPDTRSEAALPLRSRGRVLGALTIQHDQYNAFDDNTIAVLQTMADQIAVALDNARLFTESQAALETSRRAYSELRREAWIKLLRTRPDMGYRSRPGDIAPAGDVLQAGAERALQEKRTIRGNKADDEGKLALAVPIKVRDDVIGVLDTYKSVDAGEWTTEEITVLETLADQLGEALESARLYQDTQRRAARERLTHEITDKMRRATSVEDIVRTAVDELFGTMETSRAFVRLGSSPAQDGDGETT